MTSALVAKWCAAARANASLYAMQQLCKAYRLACHYGDGEEGQEAGMRMASGAVYNAVMMFMLREADGIFRCVLPLYCRCTAHLYCPAHTARLLLYCHLLSWWAPCHSRTVAWGHCPEVCQGTCCMSMPPPHHRSKPPLPLRLLAPTAVLPCGCTASQAHAGAGQARGGQAAERRGRHALQQV